MNLTIAASFEAFDIDVAARGARRGDFFVIRTPMHTRSGAERTGIVRQMDTGA
jgi:hypothetical protein